MMLQRTAPLPATHLLLAIAVVAIWGTNFVVIRLALAELPPLLFATLRFTLCFLPAALFLKRPQVPWRHLAAYGLLIGCGQFGLLFIAMDGRITPGLASLIVQMQVFFTIGIFVWRGGERVQGHHGIALLMGAAGIGLIALNTNATTTPLGVALVLAAGLSWAVGNYVAKSAGRVNMLAFVVWASLFSAPPLFLLSLVLEGVPTAAIANASFGAWAAIAWQAVGNTLFGYAVWGWLLQRHSAATISPLALLVPIFGMTASLWWLGEPFPLWKLVAAALVLGGLAVSILWPRIAAARAARFADPG